MSKCVRSCVCSRLPERRSGLGSRVLRCPQCKKKIGLTSSGERYRIAFARAVPPQTVPRRTSAGRAILARAAGAGKRFWTIACGGVLGVFLLSAVAYVACSENAEPPRAQTLEPIAVVEPVRPGPSPLQQGAQALAVTLPVGRDASDSFGPASTLARARPRDAHGIAKRNGTFVTTSAAAYAVAKEQTNGPRTIAKRIAPPPPSLPTPDWLWTAVRTSETEALSRVPEVRLHSYKTKIELMKEFKKVVEQHKGGSDAYVAAVALDRPDLAGLPFLKGNACRLTQEEDRSLFQASLQIRRLLERQEMRAPNPFDPKAPMPVATEEDAKALLGNFFHTPSEEDSIRFSVNRKDPSDFLPALMQILAPKEAVFRVELIRRLTKYPVGNDAVIGALVRLALHDPDAEVRSAAVGSLHCEPVEKYGPKLLEGFRHASPHVADHAADALVTLKRKDLLPQVVEFLDEPDPAAPFDREENGIQTKAVRELVKVNHHRNCMLCHAPAQVADPPDNFARSVVNAPVPSPSESFPKSSLHYYGNFGANEMVVRVNETYLRQDFSRMEKVENPGKWPAQQRFDHLVRTRTLSPEETPKLPPKPTAAIPSAHHRAALSVLTRLTSTYLGTKASDWRDEIAQRVEEEKDGIR
jgi:hypothetical protein